MPILPKYRIDFTNQAEKEIYEKASKSSYFESPKRYFIHSLRNHKAKNKIVGEIDFVYIDDQFIIFLESKGGAVKYDASNDEWWVLGGTKKGDPFYQVTNYLFYVRNKLLPEYFPEEKYHHNLIFGYGVMFPDVERKLSFSKHSKPSKKFHHETIEYDPDIIYSASHHSTESGLIDYLEHLKNYWKNHDKYSGSRKTFGIGLKGLDAIRKVFRKDLIFEVPLSNVIDTEDKVIERFTEQQFTVLDTFELVNRKGLVVIGGPGTGKTILAKELLYRKQREGKKCAYFCFNKNLSGAFSRSIKLNDCLDIDSYHIHGFIHDKLKEKELLPPVNYDDSYWSVSLPRQFKMWFNSLEIELFDFIVIDEAQDVFQEDLMDALFLCLKSGIDSGEFAIFIDTKYQGFYQRFDSDYYNLFLNTYPCIPQSLALNCRNHPDVIDVASLHSGLESMPCRREKVPIKTVTQFYRTDTEAVSLVQEQIQSWLLQGARKEQISVLTTDKSYCQLLHRNLSNIHLINAENHFKKGKVSISTIHSFKGLESEFVCVVGINEYDRNNKELMSLLFVGYSRAKLALSIFMNEAVKGPLALSITKI